MSCAARTAALQVPSGPEDLQLLSKLQFLSTLMCVPPLLTRLQLQVCHAECPEVSSLH